MPSRVIARMLCDHRRMTDAPLLIACPSYAAMNCVEQKRLRDRPKAATATTTHLAQTDHATIATTHMLQ